MSAELLSLQKLSARDEAERMLAMCGGPDSLAACLGVVAQQLNVIQTRSQLLLTLSTLTLTITGFSGPQIARTSLFARDAIVAGIVLVLFSTLLILLTSLRVRWVTQFSASDAKSTLADALEYRNRKTRVYFWELLLIGAGLSSYVCSVVAFLLSGR